MGETFNVNEFLEHLDKEFARKADSAEIASYLDASLAAARQSHDQGGELTVLNEMIGFNRSRALHDANASVIPTALKLAESLNIAGTPAGVATLINAATGYRAAGDLPHAESMYRKALAENTRLKQPNIRETAALHNNLSMLYSDMHEFSKAETELETALQLLTDMQSSESVSINRKNADSDLHIAKKGTREQKEMDSLNVDLASTHTNLALVLLAQDRVDDASTHSLKALSIYELGNLTDRAHYASALACQGQVFFRQGHYARSVEHYHHALDLIETRFGKTSYYYKTTKSNLIQAQAKLEHTPGGNAPQHRITGLELSRAYWEEFGKSLIHDRFADYESHIAVGLVGHGSQCFGFDDELSEDHDFAPGFCVWLTQKDYAQFGASLQNEYDRLPKSFMGFGPDTTSVRAHGMNKRYGIFSIGDFFESITGLPEAPGQDEFPLWLSLSEATLATATNGEVFADPLGAFSKTRQGFTFMPDDVRLSLISRRLGMMAQTGQYNVERMARRNDWPAVWLSVCEFVKACSSCIFLVNNPVSAGYVPYYKWNFAALRRLAARMGMVLRDVPAQLEQLIAASSKLSAHTTASQLSAGRAIEPLTSIIDSICREVVTELRRQGLTTSSETFLEWQRPFIEANITSRETCLRSL
ncbi:MAG: DUF4037 domain-containing protein [Bifidobacterium aquikefiri]|uniref:Tetratricopeptide repeat protein n=1 Tax=Bifidobacterium aquikefiri TaxID=1653207 RepID=A0A261G766_9BIFI|nr:DUF4037 domain-containing protein [Bifidobacterium aquikefiri]OZG67271.1 tetratricopeptide repeat protein [Bifidobacterium aquikefiri]